MLPNESLRDPILFTGSEPIPTAPLPVAYTGIAHTVGASVSTVANLPVDALMVGDGDYTAIEGLNNYGFKTYELTLTQTNVFDVAVLTMTCSLLMAPDVDYAWLLELAVGSPSYFWSTQSITVDSQAYENKIVPKSFDRIKIAGSFNGAERIHVVEDMTIEIPDDADEYASADFKGAAVTISIWASDGVTSGIQRAFKMRVKHAQKIYDVLYLTLEDIIVPVLEGLYPTTDIIADVYSGTRDKDSDAMCFPVPFGTAYIPLPSVYIHDAESVTATTISVDATNRQILDSGDGLAGFDIALPIRISGATNGDNDSSFLVESVEAGVITLQAGSSLVDESAGSSITITQGRRYYALGENTGTYGISQVQSPTEWPKSVWESASYSFNQYVKDSYKVFQAIIADSDGDDTADANGLFPEGDLFLPISTKYTRSDTESVTSPETIISSLIFAGTGITVGTSDYDLSVTMGGAFPVKKPRYEWISAILKSAHAAMIIDEDGDRSIVDLSATAVADMAVTTETVQKGKFEFSDEPSAETYDGGYIRFPKSGDPQHVLYKYKVGLGGNASTAPTDSVLDIGFINDSQVAQKMGTLYYERVLNKEASVKIKGRPDLICLNPEDIIEVSGDAYEASSGNEYDVVVTSVEITANLEAVINCVRMGQAFSTFAGLSPSAVAIEEDAESGSWSYAIIQPDGTMASGQNVDWSAIVGTGKPEDSADVTDAENVGSVIRGVNAKSVPVNADELALIDSADSNALKQITWENIKTAIAAAVQTLTNKSYQFASSLSTDQTYEGLVITVTFGESVAFGALCYPDPTDNEFKKALGTNVAVKYPCRGVALETKANGETGLLLLKGTIRDDTLFAAASAHDPIYLSDGTAGQLTITKPADSGDIIQVIGFGLSSGTIFFDPDSNTEEVV